MGADGQASLHDFCATCSRNLCPKCMAQGCCKAVPAVSGNEAMEEQPVCPECLRTIGHARSCSKRAP